MGLTLSLTEVMLQLREYTRINRQPAYTNNPPSFVKNDPVAGWQNDPRTYDYPAYYPGGPDVHVRILEDGRRASSNKEKDFNIADSEVIFIGCSYTFGQALSDHETMIWKLQEKYPGKKISNFGVPGYSTYQSLLLLRKILPQIRAPKIIIYSFIYDHENRNMAPQHWVSKDFELAFPYIDLTSDNKILYLSYDNKKISDKIRLLKDTKNTLTIDAKEKVRKKFIVQELLKEMNALSNSRGARFNVVILEDSYKYPDYYLKTVSNLGIKIHECVDPHRMKNIVKNDGHPNEKQHQYWANCISEKVDLS